MSGVMMSSIPMLGRAPSSPCQLALDPLWYNHSTIHSLVARSVTDECNATEPPKTT
jgi:hypothetical protein